jgi:hypothetical protein
MDCYLDVVGGLVPLRCEEGRPKPVRDKVAGKGQQQNYWTEAVQVTNTDDRPDLSSEGAAPKLTADSGLTGKLLLGSPAQSFLVPSTAGLTTIFYCLTALWAFRTHTLTADSKGTPYKASGRTAQRTPRPLFLRCGYLIRCRGTMCLHSRYLATALFWLRNSCLEQICHKMIPPSDFHRTLRAPPTTFFFTELNATLCTRTYITVHDQLNIIRMISSQGG